MMDDVSGTCSTQQETEVYAYIKFSSKTSGEEQMDKVG
jgi:hypothetical protein